MFSRGEANAINNTFSGGLDLFTFMLVRDKIYLSHHIGPTHQILVQNLRDGSFIDIVIFKNYIHLYTQLSYDS